MPCNDTLPSRVHSPRLLILPLGTAGFANQVLSILLATSLAAQVNRTVCLPVERWNLAQFLQPSAHVQWGGCGTPELTTARKRLLACDRPAAGEWSGKKKRECTARRVTLKQKELRAEHVLSSLGLSELRSWQKADFTTGRRVRCADDPCRARLAEVACTATALVAPRAAVSVEVDELLARAEGRRLVGTHVRTGDAELAATMQLNESVLSPALRCFAPNREVRNIVRMARHATRTCRMLASCSV